MMLSSLPPELLHQIIESTVSRTFHTKTYDDRQRTLCSISLVSKQFRAIAQPLLHEIVWIKTLETLDRYKTSTSETGKGDRHGVENCKLKTIVIGSGNWIETQRLCREVSPEDIARSSSSVKSLRWDCGSVKLETSPSLRAFSDLTSLHLSCISFEPAQVPDLPKLQSLTMCGVESSLTTSLLDPAVVPRLKHLSLADTSKESVRQLKQSRIIDLLHQLETVYFDAEIWLNPELSFLHSVAERTLVDCFFDEYPALTDSPAHNLRLPLYDPNRGWSWLDPVLAGVTTALKLNPSLPRRSLYLPSFLRPTSSFPCKMSEAVSKLVATCEEREIDLVFEDSALNERLEGHISQVFISRQAMYRSRET